MINPSQAGASRVDGLPSFPLPFKLTTIFLVVLGSVALRCWVAHLGHNYDLSSWFYVSEAVLKGENPYVTFRFNYAPTSAYLLAAIRYVQEILWPTPIVAFQGELLAPLTALHYHLAVAMVLALVDVGIATVLARRFHWVAGLVYLLHPAIILLTGYHSQIENLGVIFLLLSVQELHDKKRFAWALLWMVLSLQMKHLAIFFPLWMCFRPEFSLKQRMSFIAIPLGIFFLSFQPFMGNPLAREALQKLTFSHSSFHLSAFWPHFVDAFIPVSFIDLIGAKLGLAKAFKYSFFAVVLVMGYGLRRLPLMYAPIFYCAVFTTFASGLADQYLTIPMVYLAVFWRNPLCILFGLVTTILLCSSHYNIGALPEMLVVNRTVRGLGWMRWHGLAWIFLDLSWRFYEYWRSSGNIQSFTLMSLGCIKNSLLKKNDG